jgi:two-component system, NarL family, nitrate/nitrite response regulator NarL
MTRFSSIEGLHSRKKILLIDDQPIFRIGLQHLLAKDGRWEVTGETGGAGQGVLLARQQAPALIGLGLKLPGCIELLPQLRQAAPTAAILVFTDAPVEFARRETLAAGANACVARRIDPEELMLLLGQLEQATGPARHACLQPDSLNAVEPPGQWLPQLTRQQRRILLLLATGKCNKLIGRELGISEGTVKVHLKSMYKKMNCNGRTQAISCFLRDPALRPQCRPAAP